ncbi:hypothetical protein PoB_002467700 [Plakobranchus ocellatus]|uniref:Uncharacterized protein n=1 Tax=Plakobranchus ocellatus TaxID=259542 RepID=A0AAV3ZU19_9GAST|nr:hypothetical protein PoB_002467700 [Plakobranchus ocellatus]
MHRKSSPISAVDRFLSIMEDWKIRSGLLSVAGGAWALIERSALDDYEHQRSWERQPFVPTPTISVHSVYQRSKDASRPGRSATVNHHS